MSLLAAKSSYKTKILSPERLESWAEEVRQNGKTFATLNGSFDLLHAGHLEIISQGSLQADYLLMLLNSDESIKKYKNPTRPIVTLKYRLELIAALEMVDAVSWFEETDPRAILSRLRPHVHVNGAEYGANCIEADVVKAGGGRLHIVELVPGLSTSNIIKKVRACD